MFTLKQPMLDGFLFSYPTTTLTASRQSTAPCSNTPPAHGEHCGSAWGGFGLDPQKQALFWSHVSAFLWLLQICFGLI